MHVRKFFHVDSKNLPLRKIFVITLVFSCVVLLTLSLFLVNQLQQQKIQLAEKNHTIESLQLNEEKIDIGEVEKLDINNDGILDLRIKISEHNNVGEYYYYLGNEGHPSFTPILFNGRWQPTLGPELRIIDEYLISITPGRDTTQLDAHLYTREKPNTVPKYFTLQWMYQPKDVAVFSEKILTEYVNHLKKLNQPQTKKGVRIRASDTEAKKLILNGEIYGGFIPHSSPKTLNGYDGTTYELWSKTAEKTIFDARDECGENCQFMSIGIE